MTYEDENAQTVSRRQQNASDSGPTSRRGHRRVFSNSPASQMLSALQKCKAACPWHSKCLCPRLGQAASAPPAAARKRRRTSLRRPRRPRHPHPVPMKAPGLRTSLLRAESSWPLARGPWHQVLGPVFMSPAGQLRSHFPSETPVQTQP